MKCCSLVYWKHEDGWDVFRKSDCYELNGKWIPSWFDTALIEDYPTKQKAIDEMRDWHKHGFCLVN
jgi:hypothetical protein